MNNLLVAPIFFLKRSRDNRNNFIMNSKNAGTGSEKTNSKAESIYFSVEIVFEKLLVGAIRNLSFHNQQPFSFL